MRRIQPDEIEWISEMINKILVVDDQESFLSGMSKALKKYCDHPGDVKTVIKAVENGTKAIEEVSSCFYDICFLDLNLPDIYGLDVMEKIKHISPGTKVVIMTAESLDDDVKMKVEKGAYLFIPKPVDLDDIRNFIRKESGIRDESKEKEPRDKQKGDQPGIERRQYARLPCERDVHYSVSIFHNWQKKSDLKASVVDISAGGAGITSNYPLAPGNVLKFDSSLDHRSGIVQWSKKDAENFRAGIRFL